MLDLAIGAIVQSSREVMLRFFVNSGGSVVLGLSRHFVLSIGIAAAGQVAAVKRVSASISAAATSEARRIAAIDAVRQVAAVTAA